MTGTDLVTRTKETVALLDHPQFIEQIEALLPDDVPLRRFTQVAKTAIRSTPELVNADQNTLFAAIIRCAQDGLYPDKHEAVLNVYGGKVTYLPMVHGVIRAARDYGWLMHADAVYDNDIFEWNGSDEKPLHRHPRPGEDRGNLVAAFAYATHGGETMSVVLYEDDIAKRRAKAQTQGVWKEWPEAMYRKSAAHALYRKLPRSERDRTDRFAEIDDPAVAEDALYGPNGDVFAAIEAPAGQSGEEEPQQAADAARTTPMASAVPGADDEEPQPEWVDAGATIVGGGNFAGKTLAELAASDRGIEWLTYALANPVNVADHVSRETLATFVEGALPELWAAHTEKSAA